MNTSLILQGFNQSIDYIKQQRAATAVALAQEVDRSSKAALTDLVTESPVDTHAMQGGFKRITHGPLTKEVLNEVNRKGFSYPSAQASGTGSRGVPVIGLRTGFNPAWPGMVPNPEFRATWVRAATSPMALTPSLFD